VRFVVVKTQSKIAQEGRDSIYQIAQKAFRSIPRSEVLRRFDKYPLIGLALDKRTVHGFLFASFHRSGRSHYVGYRLTAVQPQSQNKGILSHLSARIFFRTYLRFYMRKVITFNYTDQLYFFSRVCNPIAYKALHIGQIIFPNLIDESSLNLTAEARSHVEKIARLAELNAMDCSTGVISMGAVNAGLRLRTRDFSENEGWKCPWSRYVPVGSELLVVFPVTFFFPFRHLLKLLRMRLKRGRG